MFIKGSFLKLINKNRNSELLFAGIGNKEGIVEIHNSGLSNWSKRIKSINLLNIISKKNYNFIYLGKNILSISNKLNQSKI